MKNNILGGLVIFFVVVTCLLMIDDISSTKEVESNYDSTSTEQADNQTDLVIIENEE